MLVRHTRVGRHFVNETNLCTMSKAVDRRVSKGIDAIRINLENIDPVSDFRNVGVPPSLLDSFNLLVKHINVVGE